MLRLPLPEETPVGMTAVTLRSGVMTTEAPCWWLSWANVPVIRTVYTVCLCLPLANTEPVLQCQSSSGWLSLHRQESNQLLTNAPLASSATLRAREHGALQGEQPREPRRERQPSQTVTPLN
jgi:hypothetical protein